MMQHFEEFADQMLSCSDPCAECRGYFEGMTSVEQPWLLALLWVMEAMIVTDDTVWITCFEFMMEELEDMMRRMMETKVGSDANDFYVKNESVRFDLGAILDRMWNKIKVTKYLDAGHVLQKLSLVIAHPQSNGRKSNVESRV